MMKKLCIHELMNSITTELQISPLYYNAALLSIADRDTTAISISHKETLEEIIRNLLRRCHFLSLKADGYIDATGALKISRYYENMANLPTAGARMTQEREFHCCVTEDCDCKKETPKRFLKCFITIDHSKNKSWDATAYIESSLTAIACEMMRRADDFSGQFYPQFTLKNREIVVYRWSVTSLLLSCQVRSEDRSPLNEEMEFLTKFIELIKAEMEARFGFKVLFNVE